MRLVDFGQTMKKYRARHQMTQEVLADKLGVQTKYISLLETGRRNPSAELQRKLEELIIADEMDGVFKRQETTLSPEEMEIQIKLFRKLSKLHPVQREKAVEVICQILDMMLGKESGN